MVAEDDLLVVVSLDAIKHLTLWRLGTLETLAARDSGEPFDTPGGSSFQRPS
jgi:hypothetical protein